jgi:hypothetical protein
MGTVVWKNGMMEYWNSVSKSKFLHIGTMNMTFRHFTEIPTPSLPYSIIPWEYGFGIANWF